MSKTLEDFIVENAWGYPSTSVILPLMLGRVPTNVYQELEDTLIFEFEGCKVVFFHEQDCCESVTIEDVNGDYEDLIGTPLLVAEGRTDNGEFEEGTFTWTFYTFRTNKGSVDIRWYGSSNGYYSESVYVKVIPNE